MRLKILAMCALAIALAWLLWPVAGHRAPLAAKSAGTSAPSSRAAVPPVSAPTNASSLAAASSPYADSTNRLTFRLSNTTQTIGELTAAPHAILLENALIETGTKVDLKIPAHLRASGEPGAFIVQARGEIGAAFRAALAAAGGETVSYIPNNAYLVRLSAAGAAGLSGNPLVQAVLPYAPYFKVQSSLLGLAVKQKPLPAETYLTLGLFAGGAAATESEIQKLGGEILSRDRSPFGTLLRVRPPANWIALAQLPGVQVLEPAHRRIAANDLSRQTVGVATNTITTNTYLNLSGLNVMVEVNDTGIDTNHPDLTGRVWMNNANGGYDTVGHGTHVAGIIAGSGLESITVTNASGSILTNGLPPTASPYQFRGMAPAANLFSVNFFGFNSVAQANDSYLQETPAKTNALISNNSWNYTGAGGYDLAAASYDAAVRDALPAVTAPQPVLFVFAAGNSGGGNDYGSGGNSDSVLSPATAKNVITVGSLEQFRSITNKVTALDGTTNTPWALETDSGSQVAAFSARGNVGVQTEGAYGRFKPDVVAPGTFVISTRSSTWDTNAYFNPTNYHIYNNNSGQVVDTNYFNSYSLFVPTNAVGITLSLVPNTASASPFPNLTFYVSATNPNVSPTNPATYDFTLTTNTLSIPPAGGGNYLQTVVNNGVLYFAIAITNGSTTYDLVEEITTTNDLGNYYDVLHRINDQIGNSNPLYYRYESGTSMSAADVSGTLALMQDFFVNKKNTNFATNPSPALLKAMLINGARPEGSYGFAVTNTVNYQGWGVPQLPNSVPAALTNAAAGTNTPFFFLDQSPTNALQTGDRQTFLVNVSTAARALPLRITLAWTDPPGNPVAALKLVNNLDLVVTNLANGKVYYGNNFSSSGNFTASSTTNSAVQFDSVNNVENIFIAPTLATNYSVTIIGRSVNVNAVTTVQTNIAQDYALVISSGDGNNTNGFSVTPVTPAAVSSTAPQITYIGATNGVAISFDQLAGANAPLANTNTLALGGNPAYATNAVLFIGQTNQWHFYVVTNTVGYTNAAFITFIPDTQAIPREGVFAGTTANSTRPEADLDLYVAGPRDAAAFGLTNLNPAVLANCLLGTNGDAVALSRGGTEFVAYNDSAQGNVYYVAVKCEDQMAAQYGFISVFSQTPFSLLDENGNQIVNGVNVPAAIPDGDNAHPGTGYVFGLALYPMQARNVIVTNTIFHQNFGDLFGALSHDSAYSVLNNHDALGSGTFTRVYDDSGQGDVAGSVTTDSPGSLRDFNGKDATGLWLLTEIDNSLTQTGSVTGFTMKIEPHVDTNGLQTVYVPPHSWYYDYKDVPVGYTNLLVVATNMTIPPALNPPVGLYLNYQTQPAVSNYLVRADLTNGTPPGNSISYGPPLTPGRYWIGLFNDSDFQQVVKYGVFLSFSASAISTVDFASTGPVPLLDDAVTTNSITVTNTDLIQAIKVGLRVDHPRISDLVFHLISPDGSRYLLMENRGADSTNGCGLTVITTNVFYANPSGNGAPTTNYFNLGMTQGTLPITYNFYEHSDEMTVYYGNNPATFYVGSPDFILDTGFTNNPPATGGYGPFGTNAIPQKITVNYPSATATNKSTYLTIIMNQFGNPFGLSGTRWTYTAGGVFTNYEYLTFTEDTNLTTTPIKFAPVPLVPTAQTNVTASATNVVYSNLYYQAEQSLSPLLGTRAAGNWQLEVLDNRTGATNNTSLVSWQLEFTFANTNFTIPTIVITNSGPVTNFVPGGATQWYSITVPTNADFATNALLFATLPLNVWFGSTSNSFDNALLTNSTGGTSVLGTNAPSPLIVPGGTYYLGFQNTNVGGATYAFEVNFHLVLPVVTNGLPTTNSIGSNSVAYYQVNVPTNADFATNTLLFASLPLNVWFATNSPTTNVFLFGGTNGSAILSTTSSPVLIPGVTYYLGIQNTNTTNVTFGLELNFHLVLPVVTNGVPTTNSVPSNSVAYFQVNVPTNADFATNTLLFASLPLNVWFDTNSPPTTNVFLFGGLNGAATLNTTSPPVLVPGGTYYLGFQNTNSTNVTFAFEVNFHLLTNAPAPIVFVSIVATNYPTNGYLISWLAPTNDQFHLQWTANLIPPAWSNFNGVISLLRTNSATNGLFQYFDDGSQTGGFGPTRFYRLLLLNSPTNTAPYFFTNPPDVFLNPLATLTVTNAASDWDVPAQTLTYSIINSLTGTNLATINPASGTITWTPDMSQNGLTNLLTTVVTDNGVPPKSTTNSFTVIVNVIPPFSSIIVNTNGVNFQWLAFTNEQFQIQWTTNLAPPSWTPFPDIITSTNGIFTFVDTNTTLLMKFYRLWLLP